MVEVGGVEPPSKNLQLKNCTCVVFFIKISQSITQKDRDINRYSNKFNLNPLEKSLSESVSRPLIKNHRQNFLKAV